MRRQEVSIRQFRFPTAGASIGGTSGRVATELGFDLKAQKKGGLKQEMAKVAAASESVDQMHKFETRTRKGSITKGRPRQHAQVRDAGI